MKSVICIILVVFAANLTDANDHQKKNLLSNATIDALHNEYLSKSKGIEKNDLPGFLRLATWCTEKKFFYGIRLAYEHILRIDPDHHEARTVLGWKKDTNRKWVLDFDRLANNITYLPDPEMVAKIKKDAAINTMHSFVNNKTNLARVLRTIYEKSGIYRIEGSLEITLVFSTTLFKNAFGQVFAQGYNETTNAYQAKMGLQTNMFRTQCAYGSHQLLEQTLVHEFTHIMTIPSHMIWPRWLNEGLSSFVAEELFDVRFWFDISLPPLGKPIKDIKRIYGRGHLLFRYLEDTYGIKAKDDFLHLLVIERVKYTDAAQRVTGKPWETIKEDEIAFSTKYLAELSKGPSSWLGFKGKRVGNGLQVTEIAADSPIQKKGLKVNDIVLAIDREKITVFEEFIWKEYVRNVGQQIELLILRKGKMFRVPATLEKRPETFKRTVWM